MSRAPATIRDVVSLRLLLLLAFSEGAAVMVLELIGGRMIAPTYGASLAVWTTILGITMAALAVGYFSGGQLSGKDKGCETIHAGSGDGALHVSLPASLDVPWACP